MMAVAVAVPLPAAADSVHATPDAIASGRAATLTLDLPAGSAPGRVAVTPWQPQVDKSINLHRHGRTAAVTTTALVVAGAGGVTLLGRKDGALLGRVPIRGACTGLRVRDAVAYAACGDAGLWLLDIHEPRAPRRLGRIDATQVTDLAVAGGYLVVLAGDRLSAYDITDRAHPKVAARYRLGTPGRALAASGRQLLVAAGAGGLVSLVLGKDGSFTVGNRYPTEADAVDVTVHQGLACVALGTRGVVILDVTDPSHVHWRGSYHRLGTVSHLAMAGHRLYAADKRSQVYALDIARPEHPGITAARAFAGPVRDIAATDDDGVWVLTPSDLDLADFSGKVPAYSNEHFDVGEGVNFGGIRRGVIRGNVVYTADWFSGIHLFDIKDPTRPRLLSSLHIPGSAKGIVVKGDYAFVADDDHGLQVVDIHDPFRPAVVAHLDTSGLAYVPFLKGNRLYLASHGGGFQIIDVSRPRTPRLLAGQATPDRAWAVRVRGDTAYVADDRAGLLLFDVADPKHIHPLGAFRPGGYAEDVVLAGDDYALVAFFDEGLYVVDIRDPRHPKQVAHVPLPGNARGIAVQGTTAYVADWLAGVQAVDIADPRRPRVLGGYDTDGAAWGVQVRGHYAYVMDWWGGFTVLDETNPARPRPAGRYHDRGRTHQVAAGEQFLYAAQGRGGLQVFDRKTPLNPIWVTGLDLPGRTTALWLDRPYLYAAGEGKGGGLTVVDADNPYEPRTLGHLDLTLDSPLLQGDGKGHVYLYSRGTGISVIDATHARDPRRVAVIGTPANGLWVTGDSLYVATGRHGVQCYDVSKPSEPRPLAIWAAPGPATAVSGQGARVFVAVKDKGLYTLTRNGNALTQTAFFALTGSVADLKVAHKHLLVTQRQGGLWDFAIEPDGRLRSSAFYPILHPATRLSVTGATAYVAGGAAPTGIAWWPGLTVSPSEGATARLSLPAGLPRGDYGIVLVHADGTRSLTPRTFRIHLPQRGGQPFTMKDFRKAYKRWRRTHP